MAPSSRVDEKARTSTVVYVTPTMAEEWLELLAPGQRPVRDRVVRVYAEEMSAGAWQLTHQGIAFNLDGRLVDGQHRLRAIVASGVTIPLQVTRGLTGGYDMRIDTMMPRTVSDLTHLGHNKVAVISALHRLRTAFSGGATIRISPRHVEAVYLEESAHVDVACCRTGDLRYSAQVSGALAFARPIDPGRVDGFIEQVRTGVGLKDRDPSLTFRQWLSSARSMRGHNSHIRQMMATLSAVHAHVYGRQLQKLYSEPGRDRENAWDMECYWNISAERRRLGLVAPARRGA